MAQSQSLPTAAPVDRTQPLDSTTNFYRYLFLWPALFTLLAVIIFPLLYTIRISFSSWNVTSSLLNFIWFDNYRNVLQDNRFWSSFATLILTATVSVALEFVIGLGLALLLWTESRGGRFFRVLFLLPMMVTPVIMAVVWQTIFHESLGPVNDLLQRVGFPPVQWLTEYPQAFFAVIIAEVWQWTPFVFILLLGGLKSLPHEPFEAAAVDGANFLQTFWHITFQLLRPFIASVLLIRSIEASKIMETVYVLTSGGPGTSTETTSYYIYIAALRDFKIGYAAALSVLYLILMMVALTVIAKLLTRGIQTQ